MSGYWNRVLKVRSGRRRVLGAAGAGIGAAAFLAACGSDGDSPPPGGTAATGATGSDSPGGTGGASEVVARPSYNIDSAVRGGTLRDYVTAEPQTLDPITPVAPLNQVIRFTYGSLITEEPGHMQTSPGVLQGDLARDWEVAPDRLSITLRMRPGVKWHNKAPVSGRDVDVDDVLFSWRRYTELSPFRDLAFNGANPDAPILSVEAVDAETILVQLAEPLSYALQYFGFYGSQSGNMNMMPREADGGFDPRNEIIGHGPFMLAQSTPAVSYIFERNPDYYDPDWALLDRIEAPIVPEYAQRVAQLKAGNLHRLFGTDPLGEDVMMIKQDEPRIQLYQTDFAATAWILIFGQLPAGESPFQDQRVRQAISMGIDRDAWIDAIYNVGGFERDGLPVESRWSTSLLSLWATPDYWLDPQGSSFGPNAKYFQYDPTEARALLSAAGHSDGFTVTSSYPVERLPLQRFAEPIDGMMRDLGIDINVNTPDYATVYIPQYRDAMGQFEGWAYGSVTGTTPQVLHPASSLAAEYWPKGGIAYRGFSTSGMNDMAGDPALTDMIERARLEFDDEALRDQVHEIQRYLAEAMWGLSMPGGSTGFTAAWPALQNYMVWRVRQGVSANWNAHQLWIDPTKAPNS